MDGFLFEVTGLDDDGWSGDDAATRLAAAAQEAGHEVEEGAAIGDWRTLDLAGGGLPSGTVLVSGSRPTWAFNVNDGVLGDEDDPVEEARVALVELLRRCVDAVPLYLGTAVWPFGPETPPSYDTGAPFVASQAGPVMHVSTRYLDEVLGGTLDAPRGWSTTPTGTGPLLVVGGSLLREPDDPAVRRLLKRLQPSR